MHGRCKMINLHTCTLKKLEHVIETAQIRRAHYIERGMYGSAAGVTTFLGIAVTILINRRLDAYT